MGCCGIDTIGGHPTSSPEDPRFIDGALLGLNPAVADAGPSINAAMAAVAAGGGRRFLRIPPGVYNVFTPIVHPHNLVVSGSGPEATVIFQRADIPLWSFVPGFAQSELQHMYLLGLGATAPLDPTQRLNLGIDLNTVTQVSIHNVQLWDFLIGIRVSDGTPFSAYHNIWRNQINRCTTAVQLLAGSNNISIHENRIFACYGAIDDAVAFEIDDAAGLSIEANTVDGADTAFVIDATVGALHAAVRDNFIEPGINPFTANEGRLYDIEIPFNGIDNQSSLRFETNRYEANFGRANLDPEGFFYVDAFSQNPFGARYAGQGTPKRNLVRNGNLLYFNSGLIPGWSAAGTAPTVTANAAHVTGVRSIQVTAADVTSQFVAQFECSDQGSNYISVGFRYQVLAGNFGFTMVATAGGGPSHQWVDLVPDPGVWKVGYIQVPIGGVDRVGEIQVQPDAVNGTGSVLIDEVWAVPGRYAVPSTQYGERIELLEAPIPIQVQAPVAVTTLWGPIDILNLPAVLAPPLDAFSAAPEGVVGCVLKLSMFISGHPDSSVLPGPFWNEVTVPAAGAVIAASAQRAMVVFGQTLHDATVIVRSTTVSGRYVFSSAIGGGGQVDLVGWVLQ